MRRLAGRGLRGLATRARGRRRAAPRCLSCATSSTRGSKHADLLIAAGAEAAGVAVLHYDEAYDRIAGVTGQATRWLAAKGRRR